MSNTIDLLLGNLAQSAGKIEQLSEEVAASGSSIPQSVRNSLVHEESKWIRAFGLYGVTYAQMGLSSPKIAIREIDNLLETISRWKKVAFGSIIRNMRAIQNGAGAGSPLAADPSNTPVDVISAGLASTDMGVYSNAEKLEKSYAALLEVFPHSENAPIRSFASKTGLAMQKEIDTLIEKWSLLAPGTAILSSYGMVDRSISLIDGDVVQSTANAHNDHVSLAGQYLSPAHIAGNVTYAFAMSDTRVTIGIVADAAAPLAAQTDGLDFPGHVGMQARVTWRLSTHKDVNGDFVAAAPANVVSVFGHNINPVDWNVQPTSFVVTVAAPGAVRHVTAADPGGACSVQLCIEFTEHEGGVFLSGDGASYPVRVQRARVTDTIGGQNVYRNSRLLNWAGFSTFMAWLNVVQVAHGNPAMKAMFDQYYLTIKSNNDTAANIDTYITNPLYTIEFWLGSNYTTGISKYTRQRLWAKFHEVVYDVLRFSVLDGVVVSYLLN